MGPEDIAEGKCSSGERKGLVRLAWARAAIAFARAEARAWLGVRTHHSTRSRARRDVDETSRNAHMSRTAFAIAAGIALAEVASAQTGFEGQWSLDASRGRGLPAGMEQTMTIAGESDDLRVQTTIVTDFGERVQDDRYVFDGAEHELTAPGAQSGVRTATQDGERAFRAVDHLKGPNGVTTIERAWKLSEDGRALTIDLTATGFAGRSQSERVFTRGDVARSAAPRSLQPRLFPVDMSVPVAPSPFRQDGKLQLVYEIELRNFRAGDVEWQRLEVLDSEGASLATFEGDALQSMLTRPGSPPDLAQPRRIGGGMLAVAFLWLSIDGPAPKALRHRAAFTLPAASFGAERVVESGPVPVGAPAPVLGPPARGKGWVVRWISNTSFHRRGLFPVDGRAQIAQRFAIDWNRFDDEGVEQSGDESNNASYSVFGQEALAVADATVVKLIDGVPENSPPNTAAGVGLDPELALGNCIVLALPGGLYATYAHLQPGSLRVKPGESVRRGQTLGLVGNSGNATGPHLHFHLATGPGLQGEGMPYVFESFELLGSENADGATPGWNPKSAKPTKIRGELPAEHSVVAFS
jgi:hypothetical protein